MSLLQQIPRFSIGLGSGLWWLSGTSICSPMDSRDIDTPLGSLSDPTKWLGITCLHYGSQVNTVFVEGQRPGAGMRGCKGKHWLCASLEDNLMTVEGGSGCLKELSIPAALLRREVKAICPTSRGKDTHAFKPSVSGPGNRWRRSTVPGTKKTHTQQHGISDSVEVK